MYSKLFLSLLALSSFSSNAYVCGIDAQESENVIIKNICNSDGQRHTKFRILKDKNRVLTKVLFENDKKVKSFSYNSKNEITYERNWEYLEDDHFILTAAIYPDKEIRSRGLYKVVNDSSVLIANYGLHRKHKTLDDYIVTHVDYLIDSNRNLVDYRLIVDEDGMTKKKVVFHYENKKPFSFDILDSNDVQIGGYDHRAPVNIEKTYLNDPELEFKLDHFNDQGRVKVAIIDSGVDHLHKDLAYKLWNNPLDQIDNLDNDNNGLIDDAHGWMTPFNVGIPLETIGTTDGLIPNSHGTHVASIFSKDVDDIAIIPFVGQFGESYFLDIMTKEFKDKGIEFANMSFSFPHPRTQMVEKKTYRSLKKLINNNEQTLFFVASGNDGRTLGNTSLDCMYPVCYNYKNIITVGAIDTDDLIESEMPSYTVADYSNVSAIHVDILAPGSKVNGASLGGGYVRHTGTSMATPWALNVALKIKTKFRELSVKEVKEILMYSAYIPNIDEPFNVKSGGMIFPRRAMILASDYLNQKETGVSIKDLSLKVRVKTKMIGESNSEDYMSKLNDLWTSRGL